MKYMQKIMHLRSSRDGGKRRCTSIRYFVSVAKEVAQTWEVVG